MRTEAARLFFLFDGLTTLTLYRNQKFMTMEVDGVAIRNFIAMRPPLILALTSIA
jgi:hypothetical protein